MKTLLDRDRGARWLRRSITPLLLLALLVGFGLRVYRLGDKSVWWDEGLAAWSARQSLAEIAQWTSADVHPPLYFWMLHFWRLLSGDSEFGLRFLSAAIGVLTIAATYLLAKKVSGQPAGLLAAWLVALSRFDIWWSQEARMYALAALWAALALWAAIRFWDRGPDCQGRVVGRDAALYVLFNLAGLYTLYLSVSVLVVANLAWLWIVGRAWWVGRAPKGGRSDEQDGLYWPHVVSWVVAQAAVLVLFAPWLFYALGRMPTWSSASPVAWGVFARIYWTVLTLGVSTTVERYLWLTLPILGVFLAGLAAIFVQAWRDPRAGRNLLLLLLAVLLPAAVVYAVSLPRETFFYSPQLAPRYLILFAPAFYALLAWGIARLGLHLWSAFQRPSTTWRAVGAALTAALVLLVLGGAVYGLAGYYGERILLDDYKSLVATLHAYGRPRDAVVLYTDKDWPVFSYHYPGAWHKIPHALQVTPEAAEVYLTPIWEGYEGIWLVVTPYGGVNDPLGEVPAWLDARAALSIEHRFADKVLRFYARTPERAETAEQLAPDARPPQLVQGKRAGLAGYGQAVREYRNGDTIHLATYWQDAGAGADAPVGLEASLVENPEGQVWSGEACAKAEAWNRVRAPLPKAGDSLARKQVDLVVPPDAPPGRYAFAVQPLPDGEPVCLGDLVLRPWLQGGSARSTTGASVLAAEAVHAEFDLGDGVRLLGYSLGAESVAPGGTVYLTLYWQARQPVERRYKVFTHLLGEVYNGESASFLWGQQDNEPANGARPTSTWRSGEVIEDSYAIGLAPGAPDGAYVIEIGLYDPATQQRLPVLDEQGQAVADHIVIASIQVKSE